MTREEIILKIEELENKLAELDKDNALIRLNGKGMTVNRVEKIGKSKVVYQKKRLGMSGKYEWVTAIPVILIEER